MRPMESVPELVNHRAPSGPAVIPSGSLMLVSGVLVTAPPVVMRPMESFARVGEPQGAVRPGRDPARTIDARSGVVGDDPMPS